MLLAGCTRTIAPVSTTQAAAPLQTTQLIAFHEERVKNDPAGAIGWAMLGEAYLELAREKDDIEMAEKAETAAKKSLALRRSRNERAALLLANAYLEHHEFSEAIGAIRLAEELAPGSEIALRMKADVLMELGRYSEAKQAVGKLRVDDNPSTMVTVARWKELSGDTDGAILRLKAAIALVDGNVGAGASTKAYFHNRFGETLWRAGFDDEALKSFHRAREICPSDYKTLANLTRLAAHKRAWNDVVDLGGKTAETAHMTDIEGLVALALQKLGRKEEAKAKIEEIDAMNSLDDHLHGHSHGSGHEHGHTHDRLYAVLLADQSRHLDVAVRLAAEDLKKRPDVYAWDTYAWALFKAGRKAEAKSAMRKALALGTKDRRLAEHAKAIGVEAPAIYAAEMASCTPEFKTAK